MEMSIGRLAFSDKILSDLPFLFFSTLGVVLIKTVVVEERPLISQHWDSIFLGAVIVGSIFIRTNGVLLLVTLGLSQLVSYWQKQSLEWRRNNSKEYDYFYCGQHRSEKYH